MQTIELTHIVEAMLLAAGEPITIARIQKSFNEGEEPSKDDVMAALDDLMQRYKKRDCSFFIKELASGYVLQIKQELAPYLGRLWEEKPTKYSRAYLETLAIIAYRQPITRAEIEDIRGVAVSTSIMKTLIERDWVRCVGHRDVPGKPGLYGTTKTF